MNSFRKNLLKRPKLNYKPASFFSSTTVSPSSFYDIAISGAGINGSALACALCHYSYFTQEDKKIILIDPAAPVPFEKFKDKNLIPDQRVVSLTEGSARFLKEMGVWDLLNNERIGNIKQMQVWEIGGSSHIKFNEDPDNKVLGYVLENNHLLSAIHQRLRDLGNCQIQIPEKITDFNVLKDGWANLTLEKSGKIETRLAIGSDGNNSIIKKKAHIASWGWNSDQFGIVCTVKTGQSNSTAWQRFLSSGPIAILPLWDEYSSIVWSCETAMHDQLMKMSDEEFIHELNYHLSRKSFVETPNFIFNNSNFDYPPIVQEISNKRLSFPLRNLQSQRYIGQRLALVGDAAHSIHPLAGQGLNLGLVDASILANNIIKNMKAGNDIGSIDKLEEYENRSKVINYSFMTGLEAIKRSYETNTFDPFIILRNAATTLLNNINPIKSAVGYMANGGLFHPTKFEWKEK